VSGDFGVSTILLVAGTSAVSNELHQPLPAYLQAFDGWEVFDFEEMLGGWPEEEPGGSWC